MPDIREITDLSAPELDVYARLSEGQLLHYYEPDTGLFIAESPKVISRALDAGYEPVSLLMEPEHVEGEAREVVSRCGSIPVYTAEARILTELTGFQLTRGVLCAMRRRRLPERLWRIRQRMPAESSTGRLRRKNRPARENARTI